MDRHQANYEAVMALHEARVEQVRASAAKARRNRKQPGPVRQLAQRLSRQPKPATS